MIDCNRIPSEALAPVIHESLPVREDYSTCISVAGILKNFKNLKHGKAAGSDRLKPVLLKELSEEIVPLIQSYDKRQTPYRVVSRSGQS